MNAVLAACGQVGVVLGAGDEDGELARRAPRDEPLVAVDDPLVAVRYARVWMSVGSEPGDLGLGHGEARAEPLPSHSGSQVLLLLLVGAPVQQRVHVALVGRLAVEHERPDAGSCAASAETHAIATWPSPMPPHSSGMCGSHRPHSCAAAAHLDDRAIESSRSLSRPIGLRLDRPHHRRR